MRNLRLALSLAETPTEAPEMDVWQININFMIIASKHWKNFLAWFIVHWFIMILLLNFV